MMENQPLTNTNSQRFDKNMITKKKIAEIKQFFDNYEDNLKEPWHMTATERNTKSCDNLTSSSKSAENEHFHLKCYKNDGSKIFRGNKNRRPKTQTTTTFNHSHWPPSISTSLSTPNLSIEVLTKTVASLPKPLNKYFYLPEEKIHSNELNKIRQHFDKSNDKHNYTIGSECIQVQNQSENEKKITTKCHGGDGGSGVVVTITPPECSYTNILHTNKTSLATAPTVPTKSKKLLKKSSAKAEKVKLMNESSTLIKKNNLPPVKPPRHAPINNIKVKSSNTRSTTTTTHTAELIKNEKKLYNNDSNQNEIQQQLGNVISLLELKQDDNKHGTRDYQIDLKQIKSSTISKQHSKLMNDDCKLQQHQQQQQQQDYLSTPIGTQNEYFNNQNKQPKQQQQEQKQDLQHEEKRQQEKHEKREQEKEEKQNNKKHGKNNCEINENSTTNSKINNRNNLNLDLFFDKELSMLSSLQHSLQQQQQQRQLQKQYPKPLEWQQQQQQKKKQKEGQDSSTDKIAITHNKVDLNRNKHHECNSSVEEFKLSNEMRPVGNNYDDDAFPVSLNADQYLSDSSSATTISTSSNLEIESLPDSTPMISTKKCPFCHCDEKDNEINKRRIFTDGEYIYGPYNFDLFSNEFYQFDDDDDERAGSSKNKTTILLSNDNEHHIINSKLLKNHDEVDNLLLLSEILIRDTGVGYGNLHCDDDINDYNNNNNIDNDKVDGNVTTNDEPDLIISNDDKVSNEHFNYNQNVKKCDQCHYEHTTNSTAPTTTAPSTVVIDGGDNYVSNKHDSCNVKNNFNKLNEELCVMHPTNKTHTIHSTECSDCVPDTVEKLVNFSEQFNYKRAKIVDITDENNQQKHSTYAYTIPLSNNNNNNNNTDEIDDEKCAKYVDESLNIIFNNGNNKQSGNEKEHYDDTQRHKISCEKSVCCCCRCWEGADYLNGMNIFQFPLSSGFLDNCAPLSPSARYSLNIIKEQVAQWMNENSYLMLNPLNYHHLEAIDSSTNNNQSPFMQQTNNYYSYDICGNLNETDVEHQPSSSATTINNITYLPKNIVGCCRHLSAALTNINDYEKNPNKIVTLSSLSTDNNEITFNDDNENSCSRFNNNNNDERIFDINRSPAVEDSPTKAPLYSSSSVNAMPATTTMKNSKFNGFFGTELPYQSNENDLYALKECDENNNKRFVPLPLISNENTEKRTRNNNNEILADSSSNVCLTVAGDLLHSPPSTTSQGTFLHFDCINYVTIYMYYMYVLYVFIYQHT